MAIRTEYNTPTTDLSGKRCRIKHVIDPERGFVYRIIDNGIRSNCWKELPLGRVGSKAITHDNMEEVVFVVKEILIDEDSKIERVALKDIEILESGTVERGKINEAIEEIENLDKTELSLSDLGGKVGSGWFVCFDEVLEILKKI